MNRLSIDRIIEASGRIDPVFRDSRELECEPLSRALGCRLTIKVETANPIGSFKGRGAETFVARLLESGERRPLVCASAGNFGLALAYAGRTQGLPVTVFAAQNASPVKLDRLRALGVEVRLAGEDFDASKAEARAFAAAAGLRFVEDGLEPAISEGAGTIGLELLARGAPFEVLTLPLGNGALAAGIATVFAARSPSTRIIAVVSRGAPAMAESLRRGPGAAPVTYPAVDTIADGIAVRIPIPEALDDLRPVLDEVVEVDDAALIDAMALLHVHAGLPSEPSGVAGIAAIVSEPGRYAGLRVATVLSGSNVSPERAREWINGSRVLAAGREAR
jgi:threonine dehydratase